MHRAVKIWMMAAALAVVAPLYARASAEQNAYRFSRILTGHESANFDVRSIVRDSDGFVWFGTPFGLLRYDGIATVMPVADPDSPLNGVITSIQEDGSGRLWVRLNDEYYFVYDRRTRACRTDVDEILESLCGIRIEPYNLYIDSEKNIWLVWSGGLGCIDAATGCYTPASVGDGMSEYPTCMTRRGDSLYMLYTSGAIDAVDTETMSLTTKIPPPAREQQTDNQSFWKILADSRRNIWISDSNTGAWCYVHRTSSWRHFAEQVAGSRISNNLVLDFAEDNEGDIWIATDHGGINIYNPETDRTTQLEYDSYDQNSLASNIVYALYRDSEENIWAGHYKHGVSLYSPSQRNYFTRHIRRLLDSNLHDDINSICEDADGNLWFATNEFGVVRLDRTSGSEEFFRAENGATGSDVAVSLLCDTRGRVWAGTYQGGLSCFDKGRIIHYRHNDGDPRSLAEDSVWDIEEDCDGNIWIATMSCGVQRLAPDGSGFDSFTAADDGLLSNYILDLSCNRGRELLISTINGIVAMDVRTLKTREVHVGVNLKMVHICRDSRGLLWLVDRLGKLSLYDMAREQFVELNRDVMPSAVRSVTEGDDKSMWMSTDNGIYNIRIGTQPATGDYTFTACGYHRREESRYNTFNFRSAARTRTGEIIFGSVNGYCVTNPADHCFARTGTSPGKVLFTSLTINDTEAVPDTTGSQHGVLDREITFVDRIELDHRQNRLSLTFSPVDFSSPFHSEYLYRLEGFSDKWLPVNNERNEVSFTNLSPGTYRLRIRPSNGGGSGDAASLTIVIRPSIWQTGIAYALYALIAAAAIVATIFGLLHRQRRLLELRQARIEVERQNRLNEMKIAFFTNISHDFRTPLSLIITPLSELRLRCGDDLRGMIDIIYRNAQRLSQLVNQLLDFRKLDAHGMSLNRSHGDLAAFVREICSSFELLTDESHIALETDFAIDRLDTDFDKDKMSKILMNLLSNAFKYTQGNGSVRVVMNVAPDGENIVIEVRDTGIGIPDADKKRIFDRFYQVDRPNAGTGSGLGLHIVREFVALHGGVISVRDNTPKGSIFRVEIPIVNPVEVGSADEGADIAAPEAREAEQVRSGRNTILIVEDNADFRKFVCDCFATDYYVLEAEDGEAALELLQHSSADIIVSDIMMPRMDGIELCRRLKSDIATSHIPVILLTARSMQEQEIEGLETGADDYVVKPVNISVLRLRIVRLLKWTRMSRERFSADPQINPSEITITSIDERLIENARAVVYENIGNSEFSVEELSSRLGMHRTHLYKKLTFITGKSPIEFIRLIRLRRAAELLTSGNRINVSEVAYMVGFNSPKIFARYFRELYSCSPREYQRTGGVSSEDAE